MTNSKKFSIMLILLIVTSLGCTLADRVLNREATPTVFVRRLPDLQQEVVSYVTATSTVADTSLPSTEVAVSADTPPPTATLVPVETSSPITPAVSADTTLPTDTPSLPTNSPIPTNTALAANVGESSPTSPPIVPTDTSTPAPTATLTQTTPTVTPEPTIPPTATSPPTANVTSGKGIVLAYPNFCEDLNTLGTGWYYTNNITSECSLPDSRFVPRLYTNVHAEGNILAQAIDNAKASGWLLTFVEPNLSWHANLTPQQGAEAWRKIEAAALPAGIKLVSPSPSQHNPGEMSGDNYGYTWIWHMIDAYQNLYGDKPHFDAMGWNYYSPSSGQTRDFLNARRQEALGRGYDVPFWVLEYAGECWNNGKGNNDVMTNATSWFKDTSWITHYAWFTHRINPDSEWGKNYDSCSLQDPNTGSLTSLGSFYATY